MILAHKIDKITLNDIILLLNQHIYTIILKNDRIFMISNRGEINFLFIKIFALMYKNTLYKCNTND